MRTAPPPVDVVKEFPFLAGRERTTFRLHPRRVETELPLTANKLGGGIVWPLGEPAPRCAERGLSAVPILQLRRDSGLPVPFPAGTDLFQLLWYPAEYDELALPRLLVRYRTLAELAEHTALEPEYPEDPVGYRVEPCSLTVEPVIEYPYLHSLAPEERDAIMAWEESRDDPAYQYVLSTCPGTKVGGYADYAGQMEFSPPAPWEYVLTITDCDGGLSPRWMPEWDAERDRCAIGTYLKNGVNVFVDRTQTPWGYRGVR